MQSPPNTFEEAFNGKRSLIRKKLDAGSGLLALLHDHKLINDEQLQRLKMATGVSRSDLLLDELVKADDNKLPVFIKDLIAVDQRHVADLIMNRNIEESELAGLKEIGFKKTEQEWPRIDEEKKYLEIQSELKRKTEELNKIKTEPHNSKELSSQVPQLKENVERSTNQVKELEGKLAAMEKELKNHDTELQNEKNQATALRSELTVTKGQLNDRETEIQEKDKQLDKQNKLLNTRVSASEISITESINWVRVMGVTLCGNKLYVLCARSLKSHNAIYVFDAQNRNSEIKDTIILKEISAPTDMVSMSEIVAGSRRGTHPTKHLFVAGMSRVSKSRCVWRVSLDGCQVGKLLLRKSTPQQQLKPYTLSVTSKSNQLLVTLQENNELLLCAIGETGLIEQKRFRLSGISEVQHAVETSRGTFIVGSKEPKPQVCEVNDNGRVLKSYCDQQQLSWPIYLSLDSDGRILVADWNKRRILVLDSNLRLIEFLVYTQQKLTRPRRLCYTEQTSRTVNDAEQTHRHLAVGGTGKYWRNYAQLYAVKHEIDN